MNTNEERWDKDIGKSSHWPAGLMGGGGEGSEENGIFEARVSGLNG